VRLGQRSAVASTAIFICALALGGSAESALVPNCSPTFNGPGTLAPGTVVAPYLRIVKSSYAIGTCDSTIAAEARSPDGTVWGVDMGGGKNGLWRSTDGLQSWQLAWQPSSYLTIEQLLPLASGAMLAVVVDPSGIRHIVRAPDQTGSSFASTYSLTFPAGARLHSAQSWVETNGAIYVSEYGDPAPPIVLWKSTDDGRTFSVVYSRTDARHYHAVEADPYQAGRIWLTVGDSGTQPRIGYSDDGGTTFTWITQVTYPQSRALTLMFTPAAVYWGSDTPEVPAPLTRWDRATGALTTVMSGLNGPFYNSFSWQGMYFQFSAIERTVDGYIGDNYIHILTSGDGKTWTLTRTPFMRLAGATDQNCNMAHFTQPDAQGRFWAAFFNLDGTEFKTANIQFQIDPTATYNGAQAAFTAAGGTGNSATFDGSASTTPNGPLTWTWRFGDGTTGSGATATHTYAAPGSYTVLLQVTDARRDANETTRTVTVGTGPVAPTVSTGSASGVSTTGATVAGAVNPNGSSTSAWFQYGMTTGYGSTTPAQALGSGSATAAVQATLSSLQPSTTYHYRVVGSSSAGTSYGSDATFTTAAVPVPPSVASGPASGVSATRATLSGSVSPNGSSTSAWFEWGTTTAYGSATAAQSVGSGSSAVTVQASLSGLQPSTTYHYRVVAASSAGTSYGGDATFTTAAVSSITLPTVDTADPHVQRGKVQFRGTINPNGGATMYYFRYGATASYGSQTATNTLPAGTAPVSITVNNNRFAPGTYHVQLVATNSAGTTHGDDVVFTVT
jgi:PKD repeat protein